MQINTDHCISCPMSVHTHSTYFVDLYNIYTLINAVCFTLHRIYFKSTCITDMVKVVA